MTCHNRRYRAWRMLPLAAIGGVMLWSVGCSTSDDPADHTGVITVAANALSVFPIDTMVTEYVDVMPDPAGRGVYALNTREPFLTLYRQTGDVLQRWGARGQGPTELTSPWYLVADWREGREGVQVWDVGKRRFFSYDDSGNVEVSDRVGVPWGPVMADVRTTSIGRPLQAARSDGQLVLESFRRGAARPIDLQRPMLFVSSGVADTAMRVLADLGLDSTLVPEGFEEIGALAVQPLWSACGGGEVAMFEPFRARLTWRSMAGAVTDSVHLSPYGRAVTRPDRIDAVRQLVVMEMPPGAAPDSEVDALVERMADSPGLFPDSLPAYADLICDQATGAVWLNRYAPDAGRVGKGPTWVVHQRGRAPQVVELPSGFFARQIHDNTVWGVMRNADGVEQVGVTGRLAVQ